MIRWILELETTAGGDYDLKATADTLTELVETCQRWLDGERWYPEEEEDPAEQHAWEALCRYLACAVTDDPAKIGAALAEEAKLGLPSFMFGYADGSLVITEERR